MHYRFYDPEKEGYLLPDIDNVTPNKQKAALFSQWDWDMWGEGCELEAEPLAEDEELALMGAPRLPGM